MLLVLNQRTLKTIYYVSVSLFVVSIFITSWGLYFAMSDRMHSLIESNENKEEYEVLKRIVWVLIWLRLW